MGRTRRVGLSHLHHLREPVDRRCQRRRCSKFQGPRSSRPHRIETARSSKGRLSVASAVPSAASMLRSRQTPPGWRGADRSMVFPGWLARTPLGKVIGLSRTLGQEWLISRCRSSPPSRGPPCFDREPAPHGQAATYPTGTSVGGSGPAAESASHLARLAKTQTTIVPTMTTPRLTSADQ